MVTENDIKIAFEQVADLYTKIAIELKEAVAEDDMSKYDIEDVIRYSKIFEYESDRTKNEKRYRLGGVKSILNCFLANFQREFDTYYYPRKETLDKYVEMLSEKRRLLWQYKQELEQS